MKAVKIIINVITSLIIGIGGLFVILYVCGIVPYVVLSGSMEPTIKTGSLCFINKHTSIEKIKEKDIIAFKLNDGTLVTHRAIEVSDSGIVTKGDNNDVIDSGKVQKANYFGKNMFWIPKLGYVVKAFQSVKGKIILITAIIVLLVSGFIFGEDKNKKKE